MHLKRGKRQLKSTLKIPAIKKTIDSEKIQY
jgi:hypothetical protein